MTDLVESQNIIDIMKYKASLCYKGVYRPIMLFCETVNICNNNCIVCAYEKMKRGKTTMSLALFETVLQEYSKIGGGALSLTPVVGDVFLDNYLVKRFELIKKYEKINCVSFSTNAIASDRLNDDDLLFILKSIKRIYVSLYGLDEEESFIMTRKQHYNNLVKNIRRIVKLIDDPGKIRFGFRFLKKHTDDEIAEWLSKNVGCRIDFDHVDSYSNWGGVIDTSKALPLEGMWKKIKENRTQCLIPLIAAQVFANGDVSYCPCCDYNAVEELHLGNIDNKSIVDIYDSDRAKHLWAFAQQKMPFFCRYCSFHIPLNEARNYRFIFENPLPVIGG